MESEQITIMKDGEEKTITASKGNEGCFCTPFFHDDVVYLFVRDWDKSKKIISQIPATKHIPEFKYLFSKVEISDTEVPYTRDVFESPKYNLLCESSNKHKEEYGELRNIIQLTNSQIPCCQHLKQVEAFKNKSLESKSLSQSIKDAIVILCDAIINSGERFFVEIVDFNLMVDKDDNLVLLDLFFPGN